MQKFYPVGTPGTEDWSEVYRSQREAEASQYETSRALRWCYEKRSEGYGTIGDQLDLIYHHGLDAWAAHISAVKAAYPKPVS